MTDGSQIFNLLIAITSNRGLFDFAHIWYRNTEFGHATSDRLQTFIVKGSKLNATAWRNA